MDVFISHATADVAAAIELADEIESRGLVCWLASRQVPVGSSYAQEISSAIERCQALLVLLSQDALASDHVKREVNLALTLHRLLLPVSLENRGIRPDALPGEWLYWLGVTQITTADTVSTLARSVSERLAVRDSTRDRPDAPVDPEVASERVAAERSTRTELLVTARLEAQVRSALIQAAASSSAFEVALTRARRLGASEAETRAMANILRDARLLQFEGELTSQTIIRLT